VSREKADGFHIPDNLFSKMIHHPKLFIYALNIAAGLQMVGGILQSRKTRDISDVGTLMKDLGMVMFLLLSFVFIIQAVLLILQESSGESLSMRKAGRLRDPNIQFSFL